MNRRREKRRIANGGVPPGAVDADVSQQVPVSDYGSPKRFYVDISFKCVGCGSDETWTAFQQKWYYETAKGSLYGTAKRCRNCRKQVRLERARQREQMGQANAIEHEKRQQQ